MAMYKFRNQMANLPGCVERSCFIKSAELFKNVHQRTEDASPTKRSWKKKAIGKKQ